MDEPTRLYVEAMLSAHVAVHDQERRAVDFALTRMNRQLEELGETAGGLITRQAHEEVVVGLRARIEDLERWRSKLAGRASVLIFLITITAGFMTILVSHLIFGANG